MWGLLLRLRLSLGPEPLSAEDMGASWMAHSGDLPVVRAGLATEVNAVKLLAVKPAQPAQDHALQKTYQFFRISTASPSTA